ncbi:unnamed protein product, partial [Allacma fusca]
MSGDSHQHQSYQSYSTRLPGRLSRQGVHNEDLLKPMQLNFLKKIAIGSGHVYNDLVAGMWFSYLLVYMQNVMGLSPASSGYVMLLGQ